MSSSEAGFVVQALSAASLEKQLQSRPAFTKASRNALVPAARAPWRRATENNIAGCLSRKRRDTAIVAIAFNGRKAAIVSECHLATDRSAWVAAPWAREGDLAWALLMIWLCLWLRLMRVGSALPSSSRRIYEYVRVLSLTRSPPATNRGTGPQRFLSSVSFGLKKALRR